MPDLKNKIIRIDPDRPDQSFIQYAGKIMTRKGIVIFPATCMYGAAANALDLETIEKVFELKQRPKSLPLLVLIASLDQLNHLVKAVPKPAKKIMAAFWPGKITLVFHAARQISPILTANTGKIGIRLPGHPVARALVQSVDFPITGTSANLSGQPSTISIDKLDAGMIEKSDLILDVGLLKGGTGSTIVDVTCDPVKIIREGQVKSHQIFELLENR